MQTAVERLEHDLRAVSWKTGDRRVRESLGEKIDDPSAVRPDRASAVAEIVGTEAIRGRRGDPPLRPRASPVRRGEDLHRYRGVAVLVTAIAAEIVGANVDAPKELARGGIVGPDLLLVIEGGLSLGTRHDHWRLPAALVDDGGGGGVVQTRGSDAHESVENRVRERELDLGAEGGRQIRVVDPLSITPRKRPVAAGDRPDGDGRVAKGHQLALGIPGQGVDRTSMAFAGRQRVAVSRGPARVRRLRPGVTRIEGEIDTGYADPGGPVQTGSTVYGERPGTGLLIDEIVRTGHQDIRRVRVKRNSRLVLMILRRVARRAAGADTA